MPERTLSLPFRKYASQVLMNRILPILQNSVIPWTAQNAQQRLIVARPVMSASAMPFGVTLSSRPIKGKRIILKNRRMHANQRIRIAEWPEANLHEITVPKLACIVNGTADYLLGKYCVHCSEGSFIFIPPRMPHQCRGPFLQDANLNGGSCSLIHVYAYSQGMLVWLSHSVRGRHVNEMVDNYLIPNMDLVNVFNLLMEEVVAKKENFEFARGGLLSTLFAIVAREIKEGHYTHSGPKIADAAPANSRLDFTSQVQEYLETNCHKSLQLKDAAAHMYMSPSQFTRRMRRETGITFGEFFTRVRIERAKELLRETDWTFVAICGLLSFKSPSYFQDLFRRRIGCTPAEYRRRSKLENDHKK